jgi:hypothetical protein
MIRTVCLTFGMVAVLLLAPVAGSVSATTTTHTVHLVKPANEHGCC